MTYTRGALHFTVPGIPQPQGSKTGYVVSGRAVIVDKNPKLLKPWREAVSVAARAAVREPFEGAVCVRVVFRFERPKSTRRALPHVRPDIDKLARALLDGMTGIVFGDDSQVTDLMAVKRYADFPGATVVVREAREPVTW